MAEQEKQPVAGTLIRGADGYLYFVSDEDLEARRLPDEQTKEARRYLDQQHAKGKQQGKVPAYRGRGLVERMPGASSVFFLVTMNELKKVAKAKPAGAKKTRPSAKAKTKRRKK